MTTTRQQELDDQLRRLHIRISRQQQVRELRKLGYHLLMMRDDWERHGPPAPCSELVRSGMRLIEQLIPTGQSLPRLVPLSSGGVELRWCKRAAKLIVRVIRQDQVYILIEEADTGRSFERQSSVDEMLELMKDLGEVRQTGGGGSLQQL